jgi:phosphotransferase family enzyme
MVAREQGVRCDDPVVLREAWHVLVHLRPSRVVARVSSSIPFPEGPNPDDIARELAVATHCAGPVVPSFRRRTRSRRFRTATAAMLDALPPSSDVELLREVTARRREVVGQPLHGDAHLYNVLGTPRGPFWHDFETACHGPREYDLAAFAENAALNAYGEHDRDLVEAMWPHYAAWVTTSMMTALPRRPELAGTVQRRLRQLRDVLA